MNQTYFVQVKKNSVRNANAMVSSRFKLSFLLLLSSRFTRSNSFSNSPFYIQSKRTLPICNMNENQYDSSSDKLLSSKDRKILNKQKKLDLKFLNQDMLPKFRSSMFFNLNLNSKHYHDIESSVRHWINCYVKESDSIQSSSNYWYSLYGHIFKYALKEEIAKIQHTQYVLSSSVDDYVAMSLKALHNKTSNNIFLLSLLLIDHDSLQNSNITWLKKSVQSLPEERQLSIQIMQNKLKSLKSMLTKESWNSLSKPYIKQIDFLLVHLRLCNKNKFLELLTYEEFEVFNAFLYKHQLTLKSF